ncbi:SecD: protein-export membrane protein D [Desulfosarcina variabilis str. Montpellier]|uniref:protein translocase subunit SecD n=1 Tax=Desulfosarcina variabilis TaxID=2300 RepID=UPI003AFAA10A
MPRHIRNRFLILAALTLAGLLLALPSAKPLLPAWMHKIRLTDGMRLGLDLQGGMHLILQVDVDKAVRQRTEMALSDLRERLRAAHLRVHAPVLTDARRIRLAYDDTDTLQPVRQMLKEQFPGLATAAEGAGWLDLAVGKAERQDIAANAVDQSLEIIRNRIDQFGVEEPVIVRQGRDQIVLQLAGIKDPQRAMEIVGRTAQLEFRMVSQAPDSGLVAALDAAMRSGRLHADASHRELNRILAAEIPPGTELYIEKRTDLQSGAVHVAPLLLERPVLMTGDALKTARTEIGGNFGEPSVGLTFNAKGARLFEEITRKGVGRRLAIVLDDIVQSAPVIQEPIAGGKAQINGSFTTEAAHDLALVLRAGALPAPVRIVQNMTVGPSLGADSIHNGLAATALGALLVVIFMIVYYRFSGAIANLALGLNLILMLAALSVFRATLTLPGIAGIVLSIGMAVDSNVLIFERMREEMIAGQPAYASVKAGYDKALWTIIDSHVTTLITAVALFLFGTGPIKGFAVTLSIGVVFNLFTALYGTRVVYDYLHFKRRLKTPRFMHVLRQTRIDFVRLRHGAFVLSGILVLLGLFALVQIERGRANLGVDFSGGAMIQFKAEKGFHLDQIRRLLADNRLADVELQEVPGARVLMVRIKQAEPSATSIADTVAKVLNTKVADNAFTLESKAEIGASVSRDLKRAALIAIAISLGGIIVYLGRRFDLRFALAAAIATFHDVLTVLGIFYLLDKEINLLVVTALLTLAGYSLSDTVVVFDRIRENRILLRRRRLGEIINASINEVLGRTIITSGTVFLVLIALLTVGGALLHDFALALVIGVIVGTYSSIFVASPLVFIWETSGQGTRVNAAVKTRF